MIRDLKKVVLTIAGSDSSGGAGIQADLKVIENLGCYGASAITVLTAQNTKGVQDIYPVSAKFLRSQIDSVLSDISVDAIKIGMLFNREIIEMILEFLVELQGRIPVVLDPVAISNAGSKLLEDSAIESLKKLFSYATIITPNREEFALLYGCKKADLHEEFFKRYQKEISNRFKTSVVVKNLNLNESSCDILIEESKISLFSSPLSDSKNTHGSGCSFSSAIASLLASGIELDEAIKIAKEYIYEAIEASWSVGKGDGPINHKVWRDR